MFWFNCCTAYINSYCANSGYSNVSRRYRKYVEEGRILLEDYSLDIHAALYHAAALGFPFITVKHMLGSDLVERVGISEEVRARHPKLPPQKYKILENPFHQYNFKRWKDTICPSPLITIY